MSRRQEAAVSAVRLEFQDGLAVTTIDDGKVNAVSLKLLAGLNEALDEAGSAPLVLVGRPGCFCAGFNLDDIRSSHADELLRGGGLLAKRLLSWPAPVGIAVTGHALAMGALLLLAADYRVATVGPFKIGLNEIRAGLPLPRFAIRLARRRICARHLLEATLFAREYDPEGAVGVGFADEITPPDGTVGRALAWTQTAAGLDRQAFAATRANFEAVQNASIPDQR